MQTVFCLFSVSHKIFLLSFLFCLPLLYPHFSFIVPIVKKCGTSELPVHVYCVTLIFVMDSQILCNLCQHVAYHMHRVKIFVCYIYGDFFHIHREMYMHSECTNGLIYCQIFFVVCVFLDFFCQFIWNETNLIQRIMT